MAEERVQRRLEGRGRRSQPDAAAEGDQVHVLAPPATKGRRRRGTDHEGDGAESGQHAVHARDGARPRARSRRGSGPGAGLRLRADHPALQGWADAGDVPAHHRPRDHGRDRRARCQRIGPRGGRCGDRLLLPLLWLLSLVPRQPGAIVRELSWQRGQGLRRRLRRVHQAASRHVPQAARGAGPPPAPGRDRRRHRRHRDPIQGRAPGAHPAWRDGRRVRRRRRARHPHGDDGALGARPSDRRRPRR